MSDDLISRKDFITEMEINIGNIYNPDIIKGMKFAIDLINSRPTVFDKEKVMGDLQEELKLSDTEKERCARENPLQFDSAKGYANGIADAIEIVEKGGIE